MSLPKTLDRNDPPTGPSLRRPAPPRWPWVAAAMLILVLGWWLLAPSREPPKAENAGKGAARSVPIVAVASRKGDIPVTLFGLGTVTAFNTVTVRSRVDGQIQRIGFEEGRLVKAGEVLVEIDPRPFQAQLKQAEGQLARNHAQLQDAEINLARYRDLLARQFVSKQQVDQQAATVAQFRGAVKIDQGAIENAKLQLAYASVTAPISGRVGLRLVDAGNIVRASDTNGLAVITQVQPIAVVFTIPEDQLPSVMRKLRAGGRIGVEAHDRTGKEKIATGSLLTADNQIDPATGTVKLKAVFENQDHALFPNQFVNVRLLLDVVKDATIIPTAAVQRGTQGTFVYVVKPDHTVEVRPVTLGISHGLDSSIESGLAAEEPVVVDGADKLRAGTRIEMRAPDAARPAAPGA